MLKKLVDTNIFIDRLAELKKRASITNDCLMASSARNAGDVFYTQNKRDFQAIPDVFDFRAVFL